MLASRQVFGIDCTFVGDTSLRRDALCASGMSDEILAAYVPNDGPSPTPEVIAKALAVAARFADALRASGVDAILREPLGPVVDAGPVRPTNAPDSSTR
jgi:hypothetical protein